MRAQILQFTGQTDDPPTSADELALAGALDNDEIRTLLWSAYSSTATTLNQALSGFHNRLLMLNQSTQISDFSNTYEVGGSGTQVPYPTFDTDHQSFYPQIGSQRRASPEQSDIYNAIRAGMCEITSIELIDSFGQTRLWSYSTLPQNTYISETLPHEPAGALDVAPQFFMPPRYTQPARLETNWLATDGTNAWENGHSPESSPICGWVALNRVNATVLIYDGDGTLLGWTPAEGGNVTYLPGKSAADVTDPWLSQALAQIGAGGSRFFADVNTALLTIEPRSASSVMPSAVLESRPLALARVAFSLELDGVPAPHQGYEVLATCELDPDSGLPVEDAGSPPFTACESLGFENVLMPVRLGDVSMDDDGLVLYWPITDDAIAAEYDLVGSPAEQQTGDEPALLLSAAPNAAPQQALMLFDPRAPVHVTGGIIPVRSLTIPPDMVARATAQMDFLMQVQSILTPADSPQFPLPSEIKGSWSWLYPQGDTWSDQVTPTQSDTIIHANAAPAILRDGFLKASQDDV